MDLASLPVSDVQQQSQDHASQFYNTTQLLSYDQYYYSYYCHQQYAYNSQSYYPTPYLIAQHQQFPETNTLTPPGVSVSANEAPHIAGIGDTQQVQQRQSVYYLGSHPAAASSELAQFSGTMQEGGMYAPVGQFPNRGSSGRDGGLFRGADHKFFGHRHSYFACGRSVHGRGRGRGRGGALSMSSNTESSSADGAEMATEKAGPSAHASLKAAELLPEPSLSATAPVKVEPSRHPAKSARCDLCRVDCTSLQILEQHRNGKRHRKNLLRIEELRNIVKPMAEIQTEQKPTAECKTEAPELPEFAKNGEEKEATVHVSTEAISEKEEADVEQPQHADEHPGFLTIGSSSSQQGKPRMDQFGNWRHGMKRKMGAGRGGKRMKTFEGSRQPLEPPIPKPKVVIPLICNLCNIKCDTKEVFGRHLSGKKHIAKLKRFEGHQALYGPEGVQALYPPNPLVHTLYAAQGSNPPPEAYLQSQTHQAVVTSARADTPSQQHLIAHAEGSMQSGQDTVPMAAETKR